MSSSIVGSSSVIRTLRAQIARVARTEVRCLILGQNGTGKDLIAHEIHSQSSRASKPFVAVNCGAIPENLMESELFGHEKGSFTGAHTGVAGRFETAKDGTLFLDEIGELPLHLQVKLLRVLQDGTFERIGSRETKKVACRVIAATNRDLIQAVADKTFREDLYYRLAVLPIVSPPLHARGTDVVEIAESMLGAAWELSPEAKQVLTRHKWPGNVRELQNVVERIKILCEGPTISGEDCYLALTLDQKYRGVPDEILLSTPGENTTEVVPDPLPIQKQDSDPTPLVEVEAPPVEAAHAPVEVEVEAPVPVSMISSDTIEEAIEEVSAGPDVHAFPKNLPLSTFLLMYVQRHPDPVLSILEMADACEEYGFEAKDIEKKVSATLNARLVSTGVLRRDGTVYRRR